MASLIFVNQTADFLTFPCDRAKFGDYERPLEAPPHGEVVVKEEYIQALSEASKAKLRDMTDKARKGGPLFVVRKPPAIENKGKVK